MTNIVEGTGVNIIEGRNGEMIPLGFDVLCEKFEVDLLQDRRPERIPQHPDHS